MCKWEACATGLSQYPSELPQTEPYLSFLESSVDIFILLVLLQLGLHKHLTDVHDLLHCQSQTFHGVTELLLEAKNPILFQGQMASSRVQLRQPATWLVTPETGGFSHQTGIALAHSWASHECQTTGSCISVM